MILKRMNSRKGDHRIMNSFSLGTLPDGCLGGGPLTKHSGFAEVRRQMCKDKYYMITLTCGIY